MAKSHGTDALTRVELVVVIAIVFLLVVFLLLLQRGNHALSAGVQKENSVRVQKENLQRA